MKTMRTILVLTSVLILSAVAQGGVQGADFDNMPVGPYMGPAVIGGDPGAVQVIPVNHIYPASPPGATGNVLVIDNSGGQSPVTVTFTYNCDNTYDDAICKIEYDFYFESWFIGSWIGVWVDDPDLLDEPDDWFQPPVGFPPSTSWGDNSETEPDCEGTHTITFVVGPGAVAVLDNFETECLDTVANDSSNWGEIKSMYR